MSDIKAEVTPIVTSDANEVINSLILQMNALTFRLYSLEKIIKFSHSEKKLKKAIEKAEKEIEDELQEQHNQEAQNKEGVKLEPDNGSGDTTDDLDRSTPSEDIVRSE